MTAMLFFKFQKMFANVTVRLSIGSSSVVTGENKIVDKLKKYSWNRNVILLELKFTQFWIKEKMTCG